MKTRFNPSEITLIKHWAEDSNIKPDYVTIYRYPKMGMYNYRVLIADGDNYSVMDFFNQKHKLFDTIALSRQLLNIFKTIY